MKSLLWFHLSSLIYTMSWIICSAALTGSAGISIVADSILSPNLTLLGFDEQHEPLNTYWLDVFLLLGTAILGFPVKKSAGRSETW